MFEYNNINHKLDFGEFLFCKLVFNLNHTIRLRYVLPVILTIQRSLLYVLQHVCNSGMCSTHGTFVEHDFAVGVSTDGTVVIWEVVLAAHLWAGLNS